MKRIAMLCVHSCPLAPLGGRDTGGMNVYVRELSRELGNRGLYVDIFTRWQDAALPKITQLTPRVRVIHLKAGRLAPYDKNLVWNHLPEFVTQIQEFAHREGLLYDLLDGHYWLSGWAAWELKKAWGIPAVQRFHTLGYPKNLASRPDGEKETALRLYWERALLHLMDQLVAATPAEKQSLVESLQEERLSFHRRASDKVEVIPCGVDVELFRPIPPEEARARLGLGPEKMALFVGRIDPIKGIDTLIRAVTHLIRAPGLARDRFRLILIGGHPQNEMEGQELKKLEALACQLGVRESITFLPAQPQEQLVAFYGAADLLVLPSRYESFGMVALEAMACGTPVVASRVGGLRYTVADGRTGFLVPEGDAPLLAAKIETILQDDPLRARLGAQGIQWARGFRWSRVADQVLSLYERMLTRSGFAFDSRTSSALKS
ncbi:MAG: glycosyltransferase [Candidatus Tectomicrobia bacterium]|uniref:Glycosyltransferase n=1 Tax=Tectimicrobiota bacterium TaxID=2528274 RepID=A0A932FXS9_UNCTE|nr:glycosyltransferase [Candidatus Tectomicrobia bacterium]